MADEGEGLSSYLSFADRYQADLELIYQKVRSLTIEKDLSSQHCEISCAIGKKSFIKVDLKNDNKAGKSVMAFEFPAFCMVALFYSIAWLQIGF